MLLTTEIAIFAISLVILIIVLNLRKENSHSSVTPENFDVPQIKMTKITKAMFAILLTILLATTTYATLFLIKYSPQIKVSRVINGKFEFSNDTVTWVTAYENYRVDGNPWYVRFNITAGGYIGSVDITWILQCWNGSWVDTNVTVVTMNFHLDGTNQLVYAGSNGMSSIDWQPYLWREDLRQYEYFRIRADFALP
jgi:hypothetical protein